MNVALVKLYHSVYGWDEAKIAAEMGHPITAVRAAIEQSKLPSVLPETFKSDTEDTLGTARLYKEHALFPKYMQVESALLDAMQETLTTLDPGDPMLPAKLASLAKAFSSLKLNGANQLGDKLAPGGGNLVVQILNSV